MLAVYFGRHFGRERVMFGLPSHNRRGYRAKQMLGVFAGMTPLYIDVSKHPNTFGNLVRDISQQQKSNFRHQRYPLGWMLHDSSECDDRYARYDVAFNYLRLAGGLSFAGIDAGLVYVSHNHEPTPLMITLCERAQCDDVQLQIDYNLAYLNDDEIALLADRFSFLLHYLPAAYEMPLARLPILPHAEVSRLLADFGRGPAQGISEQCIHHLFERQVERVPDAVAIVSRGETLTYRELNNRANAVANRLIALGVKPESLVGIYMARTSDIVTGVLGILKAGAAYVPLDQLWPSQRIRTIAENGRIQAILTQHALAESVSFPGVSCIDIEETRQWDGSMQNNPDSAAIGLSSLNLAYIIHTSGSTGTPKGVQICHANAIALLQWALKAYTAQELSKVLASTSLGFDLSVFEMFAPLSMGGQCVIVKDALELIATPVDVSLINTVPSAIKILIENDAMPPDVGMINLAGEALPGRVVNDLLGAFKCRKVRNLYGPSEDTTYSTCAEFTEILSGAPEIGWALPGTRLYVLSSDGELAPTGAVGELYIAGNGLARGYLNRPDLTSERFVPNPFSSEGDRMYRTGDLVRYGENGVLHYVGRLDDQMKIRGLRIELGEIEVQLEALDEVKTAVVLACGSASSEMYLAAFVERTPPVVTAINHLSVEAWTEELRQALESRLPRYMIPRSIMVLERIPLTANGKADKKALLSLQHWPAIRSIYVPPGTPTEARLAGICAEILEIDKGQISATAGLFELGLHSLLLIKLAGHIRGQMGVSVPVNTLFNVKNFRDLAEKIDIETMLQAIQVKMDNAAIEVEGYLE
jgi:amino acid adenylation domain-containing protein